MTAAALANAKRVRVVAHLLLIVAVAFVLLRLRSIWRHSSVDLESVSWISVAGSAAIAACGLAASGFVWLAILQRLGASVRRRWVGIYLQAQLAKYVPGNIWQYTGRIALAQARGLPTRATTVSLGIELAALGGSACIVSALLIGWWGLVLVLVASLAGLRFLLRSASSFARRAPTAATLQALLLNVPIWLFWGASFWLTARALVPVSVGDVPVYVGAFAAAWVVGFVAVYAPSGLGVREAMLVAILHGRIGAADALLVAAASRAVLTLVDLGAAAAGIVLLRGEGPSVSVEAANGQGG